ncbi:MAG: hypothetical protein ABSE95_08970 [Thermodesulfobacteriota bacterium]|jgi:hypothetical protein
MKRSLQLIGICSLFVLLFAVAASGAENYAPLQGVNCELRVTELGWNAAGFMDGKGKLVCEGKPVEQVKDKVTNGWLETKRFGKILLKQKGYGVEILVTPDQNENLKKAYKK